MHRGSWTRSTGPIGDPPEAFRPRCGPANRTSADISGTFPQLDVSAPGSVESQDIRKRCRAYMGNTIRGWEAGGAFDVGGCHLPVLSSPPSSSKVAARPTSPRATACSMAWVSELVARYRAEGDAAFEPRSRRPHTSPRTTPAATVELIVAAPRRARRRRARCRRRHDRLAPRRRTTSSPCRGRRSIASCAARPDQGRAEEAATLVLHPLPSRPAE